MIFELFEHNKEAWYLNYNKEAWYINAYCYLFTLKEKVNYIDRE